VNTFTIDKETSHIAINHSAIFAGAANLAFETYSKRITK
jgi:hypothetical protein